MTRQEWIERADEWERLATEAYLKGDEIRGELCMTKAAACRANADYGTEPDEDNSGEQD